MSRKLEQLQREHDKFLRKMGAHPDQIKARKKTYKFVKEQTTPTIKIENKQFMEPLESYKETCQARGILANLHTEPEHVKAAVRRLQGRVAPLYSKGPLQYITNETDAKTLGRKI